MANVADSADIAGCVCECVSDSYTTPNLTKPGTSLHTRVSVSDLVEKTFRSLQLQQMSGEVE